MKRCVGSILLFVVAAAAAAFAADQETLQQLISRANSAAPAQQPDLFLEVADRQVKAATESYSANKPEDAHAALNQTVDYADKAHALVLKSGKKLPHTEIKIRRMAARLRDLKQNRSHQRAYGGGLEAYPAVGEEYVEKKEAGPDGDARDDQSGTGEARQVLQQDLARADRARQ